MPTRFLVSFGLALGCAAPGMAAPQVATDIAPVHSLVARVMDGVGEPALIVPPGASPHGHSMRPSEAAALDRAEVVFWMGEGLTPWLADSVETLAGDAHVVTLLGAGNSTVRTFREGLTFAAADADGHGDDEHDGHGHEEDGHEEDGHEEDGHDDHAHAHDGADPHAWLDPANARAWLDVIAAELAEHDPDNAARYAANAAQAAQELVALEDRIAARLAPVQDTPYLVYHDAYQYFEARFGLAPTGALALGDAADPGPARIAALRDMAREAGIVCVFTEPQFDGSRVSSVFGDTARHGVLDPLGGRHAPGPALYPALIGDMAGALAECLGADG
ncbi:zinc ABC transporter substrate-binding protein [Roseovarius nitratireducens]|uniref:zinc ABC transporter substrate-binding protein n=1 Tax=Roseovarius nitratireducens TaxID=2044597 RepID=UPI001F0C16E0|nr:zinc ABC transporter substrate-binding protein [Roseovarius nitratireducens]